MATTEKRVLVVEDDDAIRALLLTVLRRRGFKVDTSPNGADALERLKNCVYSLVLLDLMMPVMDGYAVLATLEAMQNPRTPPVLVLTAGAAPRQLNPDIVAGTIRKPFDIQLLVDTAAALLLAQNEAPQLEKCPVADSDREAERRARRNAN